MKSRFDLRVMILNFSALFLFSIIYLVHPTSYYIPILFIFLIGILTGLFYILGYYNRNFYLAAVSVILVFMWLVNFILPLSSSINVIVYYIETGLIIIFLIAVTRLALNEWKEYTKNTRI